VENSCTQLNALLGALHSLDAGFSA